MGKLLFLLLTCAAASQAWAFEEIDIKAAPYGARRGERVQTEKPIVGVQPGPEEKVQPDSATSRGTSPSVRLTRRSALPEFFQYEPKYQGRVGLLLNSSGFDGRLGGFFTFSDFSAIGGGFAFSSQRFANDWEESRFTSEMNLRLFIPNMFLFTPFAQGASGYESWRVTRQDERQARNGAFFIAGSIGLDVAMTRNFGLAVQRVATRYDKDTPYFIDGEKGRQRRKDRVEVLFQYVI